MPQPYAYGTTTGPRPSSARRLVNHSVWIRSSFLFYRVWTDWRRDGPHPPAPTHRGWSGVTIRCVSRRNGLDLNPPRTLAFTWSSSPGATRPLVAMRELALSLRRAGLCLGEGWTGSYNGTAVSLAIGIAFRYRLADRNLCRCVAVVALEPSGFRDQGDRVACASRRSET